MPNVVVTFDELGDRFLQLGKRLAAAQAALFATVDVTTAQARMLVALDNAERPLHMADLAKVLGIVPRSVTPQVDALEQAGLVRRRIDADNRRSTFIDLTENGTKLRRTLHKYRVKAATDLFAPLDAEQRETLLQLLKALTGDT